MNKLTKCLINKDKSCVPVWFMRQAGRYLPEFQKIRSQNPDFIKLCLNSELSAEITLQPIKRYDLDAAIIFSDILMLPFGLGQEVKFEKNLGPKLSKIEINKLLDVKENKFINKLDQVYKAIEKTRKELDKSKSLIGFVGAPWTLLIYMFDLKKNKKDLNIVNFNFNKDEVKSLLQKITEFLCIHIKKQKEAGADIIQIFDSWAGLLPEEHLKQFCYAPNYEIVKFCRKINIPSICFPKGIGHRYKEFMDIVKPDCLNIDSDINPNWAKENLNNVCLQGGMDPKLLLNNEGKLFDEVDKYLNIFNNRAYIFNLGHGLLPETNPEVLKSVIEKVRSYK